MEEWNLVDDMDDEQTTLGYNRTTHASPYHQMA